MKTQHLFRLTLSAARRAARLAIRLASSKRVHALTLLVSLVASVVVSAMAATTDATSSPALVTPTAAERAACDPLTRHRGQSWHKAQKRLDALPYAATTQSAPSAPSAQSTQSTQSTRDLLDRDRDGYACEHLAASTAAPGEPACTGWWLWRNCSGRTLYRTVAHLTSHGDAPALQAALLDVYLPYALNPEQANMASLLADAYATPAPCQRVEMLAFIRHRAIEEEMAAAFTVSLGLGEQAIDRVARRNPAAPYAVVVEEYLKVAGKAFDSLVTDARYAAAVSSAERVSTCTT